MRTSAIASIALAGVLSAMALPTSAADEVGAVFALTNAPGNNEVIAFSRDAKGALTEAGRYSPGGGGQGVDFDTQGGLQLDAARKFLYAVSPTDDLVTVFSVQGSKCFLR